MLNPVLAGIVAYPDEYAWSSYRPTLGEEKAPVFLTMDGLKIGVGEGRGQVLNDQLSFAPLTILLTVV